MAIRTLDYPMFHNVRGHRAATSTVVLGLSLLAWLLLPSLRLFLIGLHERRRGRFHLFQCCDLDLCSSQCPLCRSQLFPGRLQRLVCTLQVLLGPPQLFLRLDQFGYHLIQFFRQPCDLLVGCHLSQFIRKVKSEQLPKDELTPAQKAYNTRLAKARISSEHSNAGLKRNRSVAAILRNTRAGMSDQLMLVAMGLLNLRVTMRASYQHA